MPKKSVNLSIDAIAKVGAQAEKEDRNFSNMLERIVHQHFEPVQVIKRALNEFTEDEPKPTEPGKSKWAQRVEEMQAAKEKKNGRG